MISTTPDRVTHSPASPTTPRPTFPKPQGASPSEKRDFLRASNGNSDLRDLRKATLAQPSRSQDKQLL
jgi:hypothetical protein